MCTLRLLVNNARVRAFQTKMQVLAVSRCDGERKKKEGKELKISAQCYNLC
jgi:hypothetical protein